MLSFGISLKIYFAESGYLSSEWLKKKRDLMNCNLSKSFSCPLEIDLGSSTSSCIIIVDVSLAYSVAVQLTLTSCRVSLFLISTSNSDLPIFSILVLFLIGWLNLISTFPCSSTLPTLKPTE